MDLHPANERGVHSLVMLMDDLLGGLPSAAKLPKTQRQRRAFVPAMQRDPNGHPFPAPRAAEGLQEP